MDSWLKKRLTPAKAKQARWTSLAEALEEIWESYFDPFLSRLERLRSSYSADDEDLAKKLREMGDYFTYDLPKVEDRPVTIAWRRLELQNKDVEYILRSVFRRHFGHFPVYWLPLFAPKDKPYGSEFVPCEGLEDVIGKNVPPEGMFLTSRGIIGVDRAGLYRVNLNKTVFLERILPLVKRTKPLHIVFDGCLWFLRYNMPFESTFDVDRWEVEDFLPLLFAVKGSRFDYTAADVMPLDRASFSVHRNTEKAYTIPHPDYLPTLDQQPRFDEIPADFMPVDYTYGGYKNA